MGCIKASELVAVKVVALDDVRAALSVCAKYSISFHKCRNFRGIERTFIRGAVGRIVAALDARPVASGLDKLYVVVIAKALTARGVALAASSAAGVVLATSIIRVQTGEMARTNTSRHCMERSAPKLRDT